MHKRFVSSAILQYGRDIAVLFFLVLTPGFQGAHAQDAAQDQLMVAGSFESEDGAVLFFATDNTQKFAGLDIREQNVDEHYRPNGTYKDVIANFSTTDDWQKFVSLWAKARSSQEETNNDGVWFDGPTLLSADKEQDGDIWFTLSANPDEHNFPRDINRFHLSSKNFDAFDDAVKKVSAYFGK